MQITVEFSGGLETAFDGNRKHVLDIPEDSSVNWLLHHMVQTMMPDHKREEGKNIFLQDDTVRPGVLVLINDSDWELEGEDKYILQPKDTIIFASTLHGG